MAPSIPRLVRFRLQAIIDVGLAPQLAKPIVERRPLAPLEQYLARLHPLVLFFHILGTPPQNLDKVPAKPGLYRLADLARLQGIHRGLKRRHGFPRIEPAQISALRRRGIDRKSTRLNSSH